MTKHIGLKTMNQGTALATGTLALPPLVIEGLEEFKGILPVAEYVAEARSTAAANRSATEPEAAHTEHPSRKQNGVRQRASSSN